MKKRTLLFAVTAAYEIVRLFFILATQPEVAGRRLPLAWYASVPLLMLPLFLLYDIHRNDSVQSFSLSAYAAVKTAGLAGFVFFVRHIFIQYTYTVFIDRSYVIRMIVYVLPFFIIDTILSVTSMIQYYKRHNKTEGEPCK